MLYSILYKSEAQSDFTFDDINSMLVDAKYFNKKNNITGCILYHKMQFIQLIEGEKKVIELLYKKIKSDKRHFNVETLISKPSEQSLWDDWSMAFYNFSEQCDQSNHKRLMLESSFESANKKEKNSDILVVLRQQSTIMLDK